MNYTLKEILSFTKKKIREKICKYADFKTENAFLFKEKTQKLKYNICFVAHIDTVFDFDEESFFDEDDCYFYHPHSTTNKKIYNDEKEGVWWGPAGLGADDRAGVFACLKLHNDVGVQFLLTDLEEHGGVGAFEAASSFNFKDIDFFVEIDRKGRGEMVFYNNEKKGFKKLIGEWGFKEKIGSFSDISILCKHTKKYGVNLSAGYYNQHTLQEYLVEKDLFYTISKIKNNLGV